MGRFAHAAKTVRRLPRRCRRGAERTTDGGHPRTPDGQQADDSKMGTERTGADPRTHDGTGRTSGTSRTGGATAARMPQRGTRPNGVWASGLRGELSEVCLLRAAGEMRRGRRRGDSIGGSVFQDTSRSVLKEWGGMVGGLRHSQNVGGGDGDCIGGDCVVCP